MNSSPTDFTPSPSDDGGYYRVIRLKTGEMLLAELSDNVKTIVTEVCLKMINPVIAIPVDGVIDKSNGNEMKTSFRMRPWMDLSNNSEYVIPIEIVLTVGEMRPSVVEQYKKYLEMREAAEQFYARRMEEEKMNFAINALLLSVSTTGEVTFLNDEED